MCACFFAKAQQTAQSEVANLNVPNGLAKASKSSGTAVLSNDEGSKIQQKLRLGSLKGEKYTGANTIKFLQYDSWKLATKADYLAERKRGMDGVYTVDGAKPPAGYSSTIKKFTDSEALIVKSEQEGYIRYAIFSTNKAHSRVFNATMVALKKDAAAADKLVDDFISSIKFK